MPDTSSVRSLGLRTSLLLDGHRAQADEHDGFIAVHTPGNPGYFFGNFLLYDRAPRAEDADRWVQDFESIFRDRSAVRHAAFAWSIQDDRGEIEPFLARGYTYHESVVLTASAVRECSVPGGLHVRSLQSDADWLGQLQLGLANREEQYEPQSYAQFKARQVEHHRYISDAYGVWLGAFDGERLAGSCGIFPAGEGIARYQDVGVHPAYRNRGIARALLSAAAQHAVERFGASQFVIVALENDFPRKIYERAGFTLYEREGALWIANR
jgi:ribosomal protein S18 acetylase RimI-like enzyme